MKTYLFALVLSLVLVVVFMPLVKAILTKISAKQTILKYVEEHKDKNGTLTMGGVCFVLSTLVVPFIFLGYSRDLLVVILSSVSFSLVGFLDDFLKVKYKQNLGLKPYQKVIGQLGIAIIFAMYIYLNVGSKIFIPFTSKSVDLGVFVIPLIVLVMIATTNSANLLDGMDGLLSSTAIAYLVSFVVIIFSLSTRLYLMGETGTIITNTNSMIILACSLIGGLMGFLVFNTYKASIFMGDVGSMFVGAVIGCSSSLVGQVLMIPILGIMLVWTSISVIIQVISFKTRHKRVFRMTPFHHHLQECGLSEPKIVYIYTLITILIGIGCVILYLL